MLNLFEVLSGYRPGQVKALVDENERDYITKYLYSGEVRSDWCEARRDSLLRGDEVSINGVRVRLPIRESAQ